MTIDPRAHLRLARPSRDLAAAERWHAGAVKQNEQLAGLRAKLCLVAVEELGWDPVLAEQLADVAIRRWSSFERRNKPNKRTIELRIKDLIQGLRQSSPVDVLYLEPGDYERLAPRFAELLSRPTP